MNGSAQALAYIICIMVGFAFGLLTKRRRQRQEETRYRENGKH